MFLLFLKNRRGSITIMLSFLMVAVLSINSTFLEASRYWEVERLYKEIEECAAFSTLSQYDRDLFKSYGLLAMPQKVNKSTFLDYLTTNVNQNLADANGVDAFLQISEGDIDFEKLYDLAQEEVFAMQINEFCAYRAPAAFVDNVFNIEEILKKLVKDLDDSLPVLNMFNNLCKSAEKIFDTFLNLSEYGDKCSELKDCYSEYQNHVDAFNEAVKERDDYIAAEHDEEEDYEGTLKEKCENVEAKAASLRGAIKITESALGSFYESYKKFAGAFDAMQAANVKSVLSGAKADIAGISDAGTRESAEEMLKDMETAYKNSEGMCKKITSVMDKLEEDSVRASVEQLEGQWKGLEGKGDALGSISYVNIVQGDIVWDTIRIVAGTIEQIMQIIEDWANAFAMLGDLLNMMKLLATRGKYDPGYDSVLPQSALGQLPGRQKNGNRMVNVNNPHQAADESRVDARIADTEEVALQVGFHTEILNTDDKETENMLLLQHAMDNVLKNTAAFRSKCESLKSSWGLFSILSALIGIVGVLIGMIASIIELIYVFIKNVDGGVLQEMLYPKLNPAIYASEMFSNRVTDISSDKRLNGSSFTDDSRAFTAGSEYFEMADAEYILNGRNPDSNQEIVNQKYAFELMLAMRVLCNIPAMLLNKPLMQIVEGLCATLVGAIIAIIVVLIAFLLEAWLDMLFMIYGRDEVDIIKTTCYLTLDKEGKIKIYGDDFEKKVDNLLKGIELSKDKKEKGKKSKPSKAEEYAEGLFQWGYKDHLFLLLILFVPSKEIYARSADLIEMRMKHKKAIKGEDFKLSEMATYVRVESNVTYKPLLPVPVIPGLNREGIKIQNLHYSGY